MDRQTVGWTNTQAMAKTREAFCFLLVKMQGNACVNHLKCKSTYVSVK